MLKQTETSSRPNSPHLSEPRGWSQRDVSMETEPGTVVVWILLFRQVLSPPVPQVELIMGPWCSLVSGENRTRSLSLFRSSGVCLQIKILVHVTSYRVLVRLLVPGTSMCKFSQGVGAAEMQPQINYRSNLPVNPELLNQNPLMTKKQLCFILVGSHWLHVKPADRKLGVKIRAETGSHFLH